MSLGSRMNSTITEAQRSSNRVRRATLQRFAEEEAMNARSQRQASKAYLRIAKDAADIGASARTENKQAWLDFSQAMALRAVRASANARRAINNIVNTNAANRNTFQAGRMRQNFR